MAWPRPTVEDEAGLQEAPWAGLGLGGGPRTVGVSLDSLDASAGHESPWLQQNDVGPSPRPITPTPSGSPHPPIPPRAALRLRPLHDTLHDTDTTSFPFHLLYPAGSPATSPTQPPPIDIPSRHGPPSSSPPTSVAGPFDLGSGPEVSLSRRSRVAYYKLLLAARTTMDYINDGADFVRGSYNAVLGTASTVYGAVTSKAAQRTLLKTVLFGTLSAGLFGLACVGYLAFYHEYLPDQVFSVPVHLQYGYELNPYGVASLADANFKEYQAYDISVTLSLPNSPANLEKGNFMLALHLLDDKAPGTAGRTVSAATGARPGPAPTPAPRSALDGRDVLYTSTRPAILPYADPLVTLARRVLLLGYHIFVPTSETTRLVVPMVERLEFRSVAAGGLVPTSLVLDVQAGQTLQVYSVSVTVTARLGGLGWFMHTWWLTSFLLGTSLFWLVEVISLLTTALAARLIWGLVSGGGGTTPPAVKREQPRIKREGGGRGKTLEDVPMTFPTSSGQPPLRYDPPPSGHASDVEADAPQPDMGGEADVEDEEMLHEGLEDDDAQLRDSGIGTSYSERDGPGGGLRRRPSRGKVPGP